MRLLLLGAFALATSASAASADSIKGNVSSSACPHSCQTQGIPKNQCRDWREGNTCYVEDLRAQSTAALGSAMGSEPVADVSRGNQECQRLQSTEVRSPAIEVDKIKGTGNVFGDKVRVRGSIEGACIVEAGYYEDGKRVQPIGVNTTPEFRRYDFDLKASGGKNPEIRVYNVFGDRDVYDINNSRAYRDRDDENRARARYDFDKDTDVAPAQPSVIDRLLGR